MSVSSIDLAFVYRIFRLDFSFFFFPVILLNFVYPCISINTIDSVNKVTILIFEATIVTTQVEEIITTCFIYLLH